MLLTKLQWTIAAFCDQHLCYNGIMIIHLSEYYYQASNPYIGKLSILDDELALNVSLKKLLIVVFNFLIY